MNAYPDYFEEDEEEEELGKKAEQVDLLGLFFKYLSYWKIFVTSIVLCLIFTVLYLKTTIPMYEVTSTVLLKDDKKGGGMDASLGALKDLGLFDVKNNADNELEILKTSDLTKKVVIKLGLYATYTEIGMFKDKIRFGADCPIRVTLPDAVLDKLKQPILFEAVVNPHDGVEFSGKYNDQEFKVKTSSTDSMVVLPFGKVFYTRTVSSGENSMTIGISIQNPVKVAKSLLRNLTMDLTSKTTTVVNVVLKTPNINEGTEFLKKLIEKYNQEDMNDQNLVATNTDRFVVDRLDSLSKELKDVELEVETYKQKQGLTDIQSEADLFIEKTGDYEKKSLEVETQLAIVTDIDQYMHKKENRYHLLPAGTGIESQTLNTVIADYNKLLLERDRYTRTASGTNQSVIDLTAKVDGMFSTVQSSIRNEKRNLQITSLDLMNKDRENAGRIKAIPRQEREYTEIKRQQEIKQALYVFLLQKKEENSLTMVGVVPMAKIIDTPSGDDSPVSPKKKVLLIFGLFIGFIIPIIGLYIREMFRYHIESKEELEKLTIVPILGEIAKSQQAGNVIIQEKSTNRITEMFRLLRTNLMFILADPDQKVINVISSTVGEGKTFICINLALSLAFLDKKVVIIGLDLRRPKLEEYLGLDNKNGISFYLSGHSDGDLIRPSGIHPNLSVITAGPVPPNPGELMSSPALDILIADCKDKFDYIIIDTAPIGLISDTYLLNRFADVSLYLVRADYTPKKSIEEATDLFRQKKIRRMYFLLNAVDFQKASFRQGFGKKYGYGYANKYGDGYAYSEEEK